MKTFVCQTDYPKKLLTTRKFLKPKIELETLQIELEIKKMELTVVRNEIQRLRKQSNKPLRVIK